MHLSDEERVCYSASEDGEDGEVRIPTKRPATIESNETNTEQRRRIEQCVKQLRDTSQTATVLFSSISAALRHK